MPFKASLDNLEWKLFSSLSHGEQHSRSVLLLISLGKLTIHFWKVKSNPVFCLYQKDKSSESKVKFRQASNRCKRVLEAAKLAYPNKTKESSLPRNLALRTFSKLPIVLSTKVNLLYLFYSTAQRCCLLHLIKWNCFLKNFLRTLALMTQLSLYLFSLLELIWNCITFL